MVPFFLGDILHGVLSLHASVQTSYCTAVVLDILIHFLGLLSFLWITFSKSSPGKGA